MCEEIELTDETFEKIEKDYKLILERACLDKYIANPEIIRRFNENSVEDKRELDFTPCEPGTKVVTESEYVSSMGLFFDTNRPDMEKDFQERMLAEISEDKLQRYFEIIVNYWTKGFAYRETPEVESLDMSVFNFLKRHTPDPNIFVRKKIKSNVDPLFDNDEMQHLVNVNKELIDLYFNDFRDYSYEQGNDISWFELWLHRGIHLSRPYENRSQYIENRFLTSYTTSITIMEQFSQIIPRKVPTLISGRLYDLYDRIFAFFAFIPKMPGVQQEVILMPPVRPFIVKLMHFTDLLYEYELECM